MNSINNADANYCCTTKSPLIKTVGTGDGPVAGNNPYTHAKLKGLGSKNGGKIQIVVDDVTLSNFGAIPSFTYSPVNGTISGITWNEASTLYVNLNQ